MRKRYEKVLKKFFHHELLCCREQLGLSQEEMAYRLAMGCRSYIDLDHGKSCCSSLTLARFLCYFSEDPACFIEGLRDAFEKEDSCNK